MINLIKVMGLPGTTMDASAKKLMGKYAKKPASFLEDVNELLTSHPASGKKMKRKRKRRKVMILFKREILRRSIARFKKRLKELEYEQTS